MSTYLKKLSRKFLDYLIGSDKEINHRLDFNRNNSSITQSLLKVEIKNSIRIGDFCGLQNVGFREYSQHEEDGILLFIFAIIGTTNQKCVEICVGNGIECNTTNLIVNHGWTGLMFDGSEANIKTASDFFAQHPNTKYWPPITKSAWITRENVNALIRDNGFNDVIDLLSIDIDGNDYWVWKEIEVIQPRVVVVEINHLWGAQKSVTVPYDPQFKAIFSEYGSDYAGASIMAFVKLATKKGYKLVGTNRFATNAFFVQEALISELLPEVSTQSCFWHDRVKFGMTVRLPKVKDMRWEKIN